jgi:hypothetical protein
MGTAQDPNTYILSGNGIHVTYMTRSIDGKPLLSYQDAATGTTFKGDQIRTVADEQSELASVSTRMAVDTGYTSFTLIVPRVHLAGGQAAHVSTVGIVGVHRLTVDAPAIGQLDTYRTVRLSGTASIVDS